MDFILNNKSKTNLRKLAVLGRLLAVSRPRLRNGVKSKELRVPYYHSEMTVAELVCVRNVLV